VNLNERFNRLDTFIAEDRLVRRTWGDGQERACLLLALVPEVGADGAVSRCPADVIPRWLAHMTPSLDDDGSASAWPAMVRRYSHVVRRGAASLDDAGWRRVLARTMIVVLAEAAPHDPSGSCARVEALWSRVIDGDEPREEEWTAAASAAAAARAAAGGAAAAWAAWAASEASEARAAAAAWSARAAAAARAAAWAAAWAASEASEARAAAWDRITAALLDGIEIECGASREEEK
jgi:hypothetical protein